MMKKRLDVSKKVKTKASFFIACLYKGKCNYLNCTHLVSAGNDYSISFCRYARPISQHIKCEEVGAKPEELGG